MSEKIKNVEIKEVEKLEDLPECFVIMPISDQDGYGAGHFTKVYEDIFIPAIEKAKFKPYRADDEKSSSVIHTAILRRLIEAPMAICDLSSRNPNVLYELGIRQAFDKPVLFVGDDDPGKIFDIGNINTYRYKNSLNYREVIEDQNKIAEMLIETFNNPNKEFNSLISVLKIDSAMNNDNYNKEPQKDDVLKVMYNEIMSLKGDIREVNSKLNKSRTITATTESVRVKSAEELSNKNDYEKIESNTREFLSAIDSKEVSLTHKNDLIDAAIYKIDKFISQYGRTMQVLDKAELFILKNELGIRKETIQL